MKTKGISIASGVNWKVINSFLIEDMLVCGFPIRKYSIMKFSFRKKKKSLTIIHLVYYMKIQEEILTK